MDGNGSSFVQRILLRGALLFSLHKTDKKKQRGRGFKLWTWLFFADDHRGFGDVSWELPKAASVLSVAERKSGLVSIFHVVQEGISNGPHPQHRAAKRSKGRYLHLTFNLFKCGLVVPACISGLSSTLSTTRRKDQILSSRGWSQVMARRRQAITNPPGTCQRWGVMTGCLREQNGGPLAQVQKGA